MDPLKLLSRSAKKTRPVSAQAPKSTPSSGQNAQPQLFPATCDLTVSSKKRKRNHPTSEPSAEIDFFGDARTTKLHKASASSTAKSEGEKGDVGSDNGVLATAQGAASVLAVEDRQEILRQHKVKTIWINPPEPPRKKKDRQKGAGIKSKSDKVKKVAVSQQPLQSFSELRERYGVSNVLARNVADQGYTIPTEVQLGAMPLLLEEPHSLLSSEEPHSLLSSNEPREACIDLLTVAPTGSGKTLAFAVPLLHKLVQSRREHRDGPRHTSAVILAPTKELAGQIVNECRKLALNTGVKVTQVRKGMKLAVASHAPSDDQEEEDEDNDDAIVVKSDILVSTPGVLATILREAKSQGLSPLSHVRYLILDEADVLLDPLFREQTLTIWNNLPRADLRVSLWSATMGSNIEELARSVINTRRTQISKDQGTVVTEAPLIRMVVGLKDSAVPNIEHKLVYSASEQGKLIGLRNLLHPTSTTAESGPPLLPPFLVFTQTIERAIALHSELLYDIPAEAGGISRIAVLHSDLSDTARDSVMTKFRKGEIWVLITTDLLSRGVDFRGVNGVVNYDIPTSGAAYIHRVGRTGRAGREGGVAVTLFSQEDIPYMKPIANVVAAAQKQRGASDEGIQKWLLDALPSVNKKTKQELKKHGVESRTSRGMQKDPKAARKSKISTKAGYVRREENKRKGAIAGSRKRAETTTTMMMTGDGEDTDFGGFE
jgi:ATP-dependent RNA helicase DDX52/ROK1